MHMNKGRILMSRSARLRAKTSVPTNVCCAFYLEALYECYVIKRSRAPIKFKMAAILELTESSDFVHLEG